MAGAVASTSVLAFLGTWFDIGIVLPKQTDVLPKQPECTGMPVEEVHDLLVYMSPTAHFPTQLMERTSEARSKPKHSLTAMECTLVKHHEDLLLLDKKLEERKAELAKELEQRKAHAEAHMREMREIIRNFGYFSCWSLRRDYESRLPEMYPSMLRKLLEEERHLGYFLMGLFLVFVIRSLYFFDLTWIENRGNRVAWALLCLPIAWGFECSLFFAAALCSTAIGLIVLEELISPVHALR